jgi:hypothetical protein
MQKLFKIFAKRFLNLLLILILSQSAVALEVHFKSVSKSLDVEVANSDTKRRQGLMYRKDLAKDRGMLFLWPQSNTKCMWMKNTSLPLSVAYLSNDGVIQEYIIWFLFLRIQFALPIALELPWRLMQDGLKKMVLLLEIN